MTRFMLTNLMLALMLVLMLVLTGCPSPDNGNTGTTTEPESIEPPLVPLQNVPTETLPDGLEWLTNDSDPEYASTDAVKGGTFRTFILSYPLTFRTVGPDSNGSFRGFILDNSWGLIGLHPNTDNVVPMIASHWAYGDDRKTMYFKINPQARWSDGVPVTADDFVFTMDFMQSPHIVAPWYNDYYKTQLDKVVKYDDHTISVSIPTPKPDLFNYCGIRPMPRHFYTSIDHKFVQEYNWKIEPTTGPYHLDSFKKGKHIIFKRKEHWWAKDLRFVRNRFNVDKIHVKVLREMPVAFEHFKRGELSIFGLTLPEYWHDKATGGNFEKGYINKLKFFVDTRQATQGMWLNLDYPLFDEPKMRYALAHAINVKQMIKTALRNDYEPLPNFYTGYGRYTNPNIKPREFSHDKVAELMTGMGWARGSDGIWQNGDERFEVEVIYGYKIHTDRLAVLQQEAKKAGIEMKLRLMDPSASFKSILENKHQISWHGMSTSFRPAPWQYFHSSNAHIPQTNNFMNVDDPEMDSMVDTYRDSPEAEERIALAHKIQAKIHEIGCFIPTYMVPYTRIGYWRYWRVPDVPGTKGGSAFSVTDANSGGMFWFDQTLYDKTTAAKKAKKTFPPTVDVDTTYETE